MAKEEKAATEKAPTGDERLIALEKAVHGLQTKHGQQDKRLDNLETVNDTRLRSRGLID